MKNKYKILTESEQKTILSEKEKAIVESFTKNFNTIKRIDENELEEGWFSRDKKKNDGPSDEEQAKIDHENRKQAKKQGSGVRNSHPMFEEESSDLDGEDEEDEEEVETDMAGKDVGDDYNFSKDEVKNLSKVMKDANDEANDEVNDEEIYINETPDYLK